MIIRISAFIIMAISFLILFYKNDSDNYMAILLQIIVWLMLIYAELCDIEIAPLGYYHETYFDKTRSASHPVTSSYL